MNAQVLDQLYTQLCQSMTRLGQDKADLFLARFALLSICAIDDPKKIASMIEQAADFQTEHVQADQLIDKE